MKTAIRAKVSRVRKASIAGEPRCSQCSLFRMWMPTTLSENHSDLLDELIGSPRVINRGESLFHTDSMFHAFYVVRSGFFKTQVLTKNGLEQVTGFQMAGEILGMDGVGAELHTCNATALEQSQVWLIPFSKLVALSLEVKCLQHHIHKLISHEIVRSQDVMLLLGTMDAEERLAAFLLNLSRRYLARGRDPTDFCLGMTREDIGLYLGLRTETVSRIFSRFKEQGLISIERRHIRILSVFKLSRMIDPLEWRGAYNH